MQAASLNPYSNGRYSMSLKRVQVFESENGSS